MTLILGVAVVFLVTGLGCAAGIVLALWRVDHDVFPDDETPS